MILVRLTLAEFLANARHLGAIPIDRIEITDRQPIPWLGGGWCYMSELAMNGHVDPETGKKGTGWVRHGLNEMAILPHNLRLLCGPMQEDCPTKDQAVDLLSDACLKYAADRAAPSQYDPAVGEEDDNLPVTEEWLLSIGAIKPGLPHARKLYIGEVNFDDLANGTVSVCDWTDTAVLGRRFKTRGEVRALLAALGIATTRRPAS